ncbi:MAG: alpha-L-fucosidase, partial [Bacteroidota bacterium]|nr:alpha-L-fucosidase [Bacteroidota bacterium]
MKNMKWLLPVALFTGICFQSMAQQQDLPVAPGKFKPTDASLVKYQYPEWFRDAKFGIWAHWGPQAVPRRGDWYARNLYLQNGKPWEKEYYDDHLKRYGHPSEKGYKDIIPLWKAEKWEPEALMKLYKETGAKYFVSMGTHHDNFFLWNSKLHKWNSVNMGPHKDVVGLWQAAAKKEGLYFGVSEHLAASYTWFQKAHSADKTGEKAGVPYDGNDPRYEDLYHGKAANDDTGWMTKNPVWQKEWFDRIKELVDLYHPDFLYSDSKIPFENEVGRSLIAHFYNQNISRHNGRLEAVYTCKEPSKHRFVQDVERGVLDSISPYPWQTDTSIGDWFYRTGQKYKTAPEVIQMLVDIVSKNGNLLLNVVQTPEGDLEPDVIAILKGIGSWIKDNGEAIYGTRPWKVYGEGPSTTQAQDKGQFGGLKDVRKYTSADIRYTTKQGAVYAFCMENPTQDIHLKSLGKNSKLSGKKIS